MKYIKPSIEINEAQAAQMLAESLPIYDDTIDGSSALAKEDDTWDIWEDKLYRAYYVISTVCGNADDLVS